MPGRWSAGSRPEQRIARRPGGRSERAGTEGWLIAGGHSNKAISARLNISVKTVETYKARAMEKLGFHSRVDVVRYAAEQGWLGEQ